MVDIKLNYNLGYKWYTNGKIYVKGYLFDKSNKLFSDEDLINYFKDVKNEQNFLEKLNEANGIFSVIIKLNNNKAIFATDITRTFPIFYTLKGKNLYISDDAFYLKEKFSLEIDELQKEEFLLTGFVTGKYTLAKKLFQVQAGEYVVWDGNNLKNNMYFYYCTSRYNEKSYDKLKEELLEILDNIVNRLIAYANGKRIVIPLSGGYDSRLIATLLKKKGYENVLCFTYGRPDSFEVKISKKVAKALNYDWYFIEYNEKTIPKEYNKQKWFLDYTKFSFNLVSLSHIQDFFAVKHLKENNILNEDDIIIPGHTGDFLSTGHLTKELLKLKDAKKMIIKKHYIFQQKISNRIKEKLDEILPSKNCIEHTIAENFNQKERQAKFIVNANRVYEFFGFKHAIPLWDKELVDFFRTVPLEYKLGCVLYEDVLLNNLFRKYGINFKKDKDKDKIYFLKMFIPKVLKSKIKDMFPLNNDINNFRLILEPLCLELDYKINLFKINYIIALWLIRKYEI